MDDITHLLRAARNDRAAHEQLFARLYPEIKAMARSRLRRSGDVTSLDTTALVHETYLKLTTSGALNPACRGEFFAYVGRVMRSIVVDHVRGRGADKRGGGVPHLTLDTLVDDPSLASMPVNDLDVALVSLESVDARLYQIVEMRFFAGLDTNEIAATLGCSDRTVKRDWQKARTLLGELLRN